MQKLRSLTVFELFKKVSAFDFVLMLIVIIIPAVVIAKGKPLKEPQSTRAIARQANPVSIASINPISVGVEEKITIKGTGFNQANTLLVQGRSIGVFASLDENTILFELPENTSCKIGAACPIQVANELGRSNSYPITFNGSVNDDDSPIPALSIVTQSIPDATLGDEYSETLIGEGGAGTYLWEVVLGQLPSGMSLESNSGMIIGTPTTSGNFTFTVRLTDVSLQETTKSFNLTVISPQVTDGLVDLQRIILTGRVVDSFTQKPISTYELNQHAYNTGETEIQKNLDGTFVIDTRVDNLTASSLPNNKYFGFISECYFNRTALSLVRDKLHNNFVLYTYMFDLKSSPDFMLIQSSVSPGDEVATIDLGDIKMWPAADLAITAAMPVSAIISYPEDGTGLVSRSQKTNTLDVYSFAPFDYPIDFILTDEEGNQYSYQDYYHSSQHQVNGACGQKLQVNLSADGTFSFQPLSPQP